MDNESGLFSFVGLFYFVILTLSITFTTSLPVTQTAAPPSSERTTQEPWHFPCGQTMAAMVREDIATPTATPETIRSHYTSLRSLLEDTERMVTASLNGHYVSHM